MRRLLIGKILVFIILVLSGLEYQHQDSLLSDAYAAKAHIYGSDSVDVWDPPAVGFDLDYIDIYSGEIKMDSLLRIGEFLFKAKFNRKDGAGRPTATGDSKPTPREGAKNIGMTRISGPDAMACSSCHNEPRLGGSGDFVANVFVGAHFMSTPSHSIEISITNERNTIGLFGSGIVEALAKEISTDLQRQREQAIAESLHRNETVVVRLHSKGIAFGSIEVSPNGVISFDHLEGIDYDLIIRPFGVKGIAASLREFTIAALNHHHGIQAEERFGWERTGLLDFDGDGISPEMSIGNLTAIELFQASLPSPPNKFSNEISMRDRELNGELLFEKLNCDHCHKRRLPLANTTLTFPNEFNRPGNLKPEHVPSTLSLPLAGSILGPVEVDVYTDFKRHILCDSEIQYFCNEKLKQDNVDTELFLTAKLWDLATSAPYGHRGDLRTISEAILVHGGEARAQRDNFLRLQTREKEDLILFLLTLGRE